MKRKIIWLVVSCLMVAALVLASCAKPAVAPKEEVAPPKKEEVAPPKKEEVAPPKKEEVAPPKEEMVKVTLKKLDGTVVEKLVEKPRYGGTFTDARTYAPLYFDEYYGHAYGGYTLGLTNETLIGGDWAKGPAGTGETSWLTGGLPPPNVQGGGLAVSWERPEPGTIIYHLRKGVHWFDKPPMNGRELVASDVAFAIKRQFQSKRSYAGATYPYETHIQSVTTPDKYTVVIKSFPGVDGLVFEMASGHFQGGGHPPEVIAKYGDMNDWRNNSGTGAFMVTDYVPGTSVSFVRNPNYWMKDPLHPDNQLPYLDGVKFLVIPDWSTRMAALRTGKIDQLAGLNWDDAASLIKTNPGLKYVNYFSDPPCLWMRLDKPELPFYDIRVRQALAMAIDYQEMSQTLYGGRAAILSVPVAPYTELMDIYIPLEELPESARRLREYHPEEAKRLLAEAGYPNGFKTEVVTREATVDMLSVMKAYFAKNLNVDMDIIVKEEGAFVTIGTSRLFKEMYMETETTGVGAMKFPRLVPGGQYNWGNVNDPVITQAYKEVTALYWDETKRRERFRQVVPYIIELSHVIQAPAPHFYTFWQPWVKNYHGERWVGYVGTYGDWVKYLWSDQDVKYQMTGRR